MPPQNARPKPHAAAEKPALASVEGVQKRERKGAKIVLAGGASPKNVFWQVAGQATLGTTSHFEGIILSKTAITVKTKASMKGRALGQTLVALDDNVVTSP